MEIKNQLVVIDSPPPFVSGFLHIGHFYQYSLIKLIKYYNLLSSSKKIECNNFYQGFDVHGLPLELRSKIQGKDKNELTKDYLEKMKKDFDLLFNDTKTKYWTTAEKEFEIKISSIFKLLTSKKLLYFSTKAIPYCLNCDTTLSKQEITKFKKEKKQYWIKGILIDKRGAETSIEIMTTAPAYFSRIAAVFKNPEDNRYPEGSIRLMITDRIIPLLSDSSVDFNKGSGLVGSCCFNNHWDYELIIKNKLDFKEISTIPLFQQEELELFIRDNKIKEGIMETGMLEIHSERSSCNKEISYVSSRQLFLKVDSFKKYFLKEVIKYDIIEEKHKNYLIKWCENLEDWCISRQYKNGTRIPLFYKDLLSSETSLPGYSKYQSVLDCWFQSAISFLLVKTHYEVPIESILRVQGYEISRTWLLYSYVMGYYLGFDMRQMKVMLTGLVLDSTGKKISKSNNKEVFSFKNIGALRLWSISFLPSKTEKRISRSQIELFEKRVLVLNKLINQCKVDPAVSSTLTLSESLNKIMMNNNYIYLEEILKIGNHLKRTLSTNDFNICKIILEPFLEEQPV